MVIGVKLPMARCRCVLEVPGLPKLPALLSPHADDAGLGPAAVTRFFAAVIARRAIGQRDVSMAVTSDVRILRVGKVGGYQPK